VHTPTGCSAKNGTFAALQMLQSQEIDVVFGPICSAGKSHLLIPETAWISFYMCTIVDNRDTVFIGFWTPSVIHC